MKIKMVFVLLLMVLLLSNCVVVKEYEKVNINDPDMMLSDKSVDRNLTTMHSYREAASGGDGGKTGGGCGCN